MSDNGKKLTQVHLRLSFPNGGSLGEADIALIETIQRCRSILGTSKLMGLSYRKTWLMTDALNRTFESKVIDTFPGRRGAGSLGNRWPAPGGAFPVGRTPRRWRQRRRLASLQLLWRGRSSRKRRPRLRKLVRLETYFGNRDCLDHCPRPHPGLEGVAWNRFPGDERVKA